MGALYGTPDRRLRLLLQRQAEGPPQHLSLPIARDGQQSDLSPVRSRRRWTPKPGVGVQNSWICAAHLVTAETALAAPNGGGFRGGAKAEVTFRDGIAVAPSSARRVRGCRVITWQARPRPLPGLPCSTLSAPEADD